LARDPPRGGPFLGRTIEQVTRQARSDVAIFFEGGGETIRRVLLSVAETANDRASLQLAKRLLEAGAEVDVLRPRPPLDRPTLVDEFVEEPRHRHVRVRPMRLEEGLAEGCDLLVVTLASGESSYHRTLRAWLEHRDRGVSLLVVRGRPDLADHTPIEPQEHE
jgi:hypothetical protein